MSLSPNWIGRRLCLLLRKTYAGNPIIDAEVEGIKLRAHVKNNVSERKFLTMPQFFDLRERNFIQKHIPKNGTFIDIGANIGLYTLWCGKFLNPQGTILAFEPNPELYKRLRVNLSFNNFKGQIFTFPIALSNKKGRTNLILPQNNLGEAKISDIEESIKKSDKVISIETNTLKNILKEKNIESVDCLKIDVEGAEPLILDHFFKNATPSLYPKHLIVENSIDERGNNYLKELLTYGYKIVERTKMNIIFTIGR